MATYRNQPKKKGPDVSVPGKKKVAPQPARSSFAKRVKTRRRKADAAAAAAPRTSSAATKQAKQPTLLTREERLAIARGERVAQPPSAVQSTGVAPLPASVKEKTSPQPGTRHPTSRKPQQEPDDGFVAVGRILGPFGLKGELKVQSLTDNADRFAPKSRLHAAQQLVTVTASREAGQHIYIKLKGFPDRTSVEKFRGALLQIPESDLSPLAEGEYYRFQLLGLEVFDRAGAKLGVVAQILETGATDVYRITAPGTPDLLLPATPDVIIEIDLTQKRMTVDPPEWT